MIKTIAILALPGVQLLDVAGPMDVFAQANVEAKTICYDLKVLGISAESIVSSSGIKLQPDIVIPRSGIDFDTLLIAGSPDARFRTISTQISDWLIEATRSSRRFGSVCTGAFFLAATGLLDHRHLTTHWAVADELASLYPTLKIDKDSMYIKDGKIRTAAGVTAGMDMALALVEEDLGRDIALRVSEQLVMYFKRPGGQLQFSRHQDSSLVVRSVLQEVQRWVHANPALDHSISNLAKHAGMSTRHFSRIFRDEVGMSPISWVETTRIESAKRLLQNGHDTPKVVAYKCGFANADTLRRTFRKYVGLTPAEFRRNYPIPELT